MIIIIKIYIDPGHGGKDPGAVDNGIKEKDIALIIGKRIRDILAEEYEGVATKMSRSGDTFPSLNARTSEANSWGADLFLSIHVNAGGGTGFETYIHTKPGARTSEIQAAIHNEILEQISERGINDRGRKRKNFHVLRETRMSSVLTENLFIDTKSDADKLKDPDFLERLARGHTEGIEKAFNLKHKAKSQTQLKNDTGALYRVQVGAFSDRQNAERLVEDLKKHGYSPYISDK